MYLESKSITSPVYCEDVGFVLGETLLEQGSGPVNDDALSTDNDIYIVCDGATSLVKEGNGQYPVSGGQCAAYITAEVFSQNKGTLPAMVARANDLICSAMHDAAVDFSIREHLWTTSFAAARIAGGRFEWAQAGDCMIMFIHDDGSSRLVTEETGQDVELLEKWKQVGETVSGTIHQVLAKEIAAVRRNMNRTYGVLNGEPESLNFVKYGSVSLQSVAAILMFSDGLWPPSKDPNAGLDVDGLSVLYKNSGLAGVRDYIRAVQKDDPRCCYYPRFKKHDDISAIALTKKSSLSQEVYRKNN